jgi:hypothetical protein
MKHVSNEIFNRRFTRRAQAQQHPRGQSFQDHTCDIHLSIPVWKLDCFLMTNGCKPFESCKQSWQYVGCRNLTMKNFAMKIQSNP